ncbi:MAG: GTP pyrophosphokinase family protein [Bacilli bacterium]
MILERKIQMNLQELKKQFDEIEKAKDFELISRQSGSLIDILSLMNVYNSAMKEVSTKLEILDEEFHVNYNNNPIHHLECRVKSIKSITDKIKKYDTLPTVESIREHIKDIAGIRVICNFVDDIYLIEKLLLGQEDIELIKRKDYIKNPKENGYRSLHIVVQIPVFLSNRTENVPVEVQLRTVAMDYWASLEHSLRYKNSIDDMEKHSQKLLDCANSLADTEQIMQEIRNDIR